MIPTRVEQLLPGEEALLASSSLRFHAILAAHPFGTDSFRRSLMARETTLGSATMAHESLLLLCSLLQSHVSDLSASVLWHEATVSAAATQEVLPTGVVVLKSITVQLRDQMVLVTGMGNFHLHRDHLRVLADQLQLPRRVVKHCTLNPGHLDPLHLYGMLHGMVSPFFPRSRAAALAAIALVSNEAPATPACTDVAISLSRFESLRIPLTIFPVLFHHYACITYPQLRFINL
jgi:hypothetical protein